MTKEKSPERLEWEAIKAQALIDERKQIKEAERQAARYRNDRDEPDFQFRNVRRKTKRN